MYWWYKDAFIDRYAQPELEHLSNARRTKARPVMKLFGLIKQSVVGFLQQQNAKLVIKQSARAMSKLNDAQLSDIGLTREDLYLMSKGRQPVPYAENLDVELKPQTLELVSVNNQTPVQEKPGVEDSYQRAA